MFYADFVLSKKGPLSKVWLAAHWEKKLSKAQIYETNVDEAVTEIMRPSQKLALRTTGHLLLGIVRVYSRKTKYLLADCNEAFLKIKLAFRSINNPNPVLPTFTIQDIYGEFGDNILPEFDDEDLNHAPICQSRLDDITLKEDVPQKFEYAIGGDDDDDFGEIAAGVVPEDYQKMMEDSRMDIERELALNASMATNDLFGRSREPTPFLNDAHAPGNAIFGDDDFAGGAGDDEHVDENDHNFQSSSGVEMNHMNEEMEYENEQIIMNHGAMTPLRSETPMTQRPPSPTGSVATSVTNMDQEDTVESFYERQAQKRAMQQQVNSKRRRVDEVKMISGDEMKANMADFSDTLNRLDLAPPTRDEMLRKKRGMMEYLHHYPGMINFGKARQFIRLYQSNLIIKKSEDTDAKNETITNALGLREIGEEEIQAQQQEMDLNLDDQSFTDDFEELAPLDLDNLDMLDMQPSMDDYMEDDVPTHNPLSPFIIQPDEEDMSPNEKRRKREQEDEKEKDEVDDDNRWSKRTHALLQTISTKLDHTNGQAIELEDLMKKNTSRKIAASKFYSLLCLKKNQCVEVIQKEPYGEIKIQAGPNIDINMI